MTKIRHMKRARALSAATTAVLIFTAAPALASITGAGERRSLAASAFDAPLIQQYAVGNLKPVSPKLANNDPETSRQDEVGRKNMDGLQKGALYKMPSVLLDRRI